jgi:hypothetical protein
MRLSIFTKTAAGLLLAGAGAFALAQASFEHRVWVPALTVAAPAPLAQLSSGTLNFGGVNVGAQAPAQAVVLTNTGGSPLAVHSVAAPAPFSVSHNCPALLAPAASCTLQAGFAPSAAGAASASLAVSTNATGSPHTIGLAGAGLGVPQLGASPASVDFGSFHLGQSVAARTLTISSTGSAAAAPSLGVSGPFVLHSIDCPASLAPGASCTAQLLPNPSAAGAISGSAQLLHDGVLALSVPLSANVLPPLAPVASFSSSALDFASVNVGQSAVRSALLTNTGDAPMTVTVGALGAAAASAGFSLTHNCPASLAPAASCTLQADFAPSAAGAVSASFDVATNATGSPHTISLAGIGIQAFIEATGGTVHDSGNYRVHVFNASGIFTLTSAPAGSVLEVLVVAGGGGGAAGGANVGGGGGGAGGFVLTSVLPSGAAPLNVVVGAGGAGGTGNGGTGGQGADSSVSGSPIATIAAAGGGRGGMWGGTAGSGGSGGGISCAQSEGGQAAVFGLGTPGQGHDGARGPAGRLGATGCDGGGGGGASAAAAFRTPGAGRTAGLVAGTFAAGGLGGLHAGGAIASVPANTGNGGPGGNSMGAGGAGASGVVVFRYRAR